MKEKTFKKAQIESMQSSLEKMEKELYIVHNKSQKQSIELERLRDENIKLSTEVITLSDNVKMVEN